MRLRGDRLCVRHTVLRDEVVHERSEARRNGAHGAGDEEHEQKTRYDDPQHIADIGCRIIQAERGDELRREQDEKCADEAELHGAAAEEPARNGEHEKRKDERDEHAPQRILCIGRERAVFGRVRKGAEGDLHVCGKVEEQNDRADHTAKDHDAAPKAVHRGKNTLL